MINDELLQKHCLHLMQLISQGVELREILTQIIEYIDNRFSSHELYASYFTVDIHSKKLNHLASSSSQTPLTSLFNDFEKIYFDKISKDLQLGKTVVISKDEHSDVWDEFIEITKENSYESALISPVNSSHQYLLGILLIMFRKQYRPDFETLQLLKQYSQIASIAIELSQTERKQSNTLPSGINNTNVSDESKKARELEKALENEQFKIYYQPYYGTKKKEFGLEALVRWQHPNFGLLSPASFIEVAEKTGFIIDLEEWVLQKSITDLKDLENKGLNDINLSVNISAQQFENGNYPNKVMDVLEQNKLDPKQLTLEITERFLVEDNSISEVEKIKDLGVRISIDDFGTSYSSLHYLKDLPVDELKIDRSFISNIDADFNNKKIVEMIIMLGHQLNLTTVAEGIETEDQYNILKDINCDRVQGYLFSKPVPIKKIESIYNNYLKSINFEK